MDMQLPATGCSDFMATHLPVYFERFGMHYTIDGPQLEYFVYKKENGEDISCSLTGYFDGQDGTINMMTFYPGICSQKDCHYLSAVCFFLIMQHFANFHHIESDCQICSIPGRGFLIASGPCSRILIFTLCFTAKETGSISRACSNPRVWILQ